MLNWDDPLAKFNEPEAKAQAANALNPAHNTGAHPHAGDGIVTNDALMSTAGAAPSVNPNPAPATIEAVPTFPAQAWKK